MHDSIIDISTSRFNTYLTRKKYSTILKSAMYLYFTREYMINLFFDFKIQQTTFYKKIFVSIFQSQIFTFIIIIFQKQEHQLQQTSFFCNFVILDVETLKPVICRENKRMFYPGTGSCINVYTIIWVLVGTQKKQQTEVNTHGSKQTDLVKKSNSFFRNSSVLCVV